MYDLSRRQQGLGDHGRGRGRPREVHPRQGSPHGRGREQPHHQLERARSERQLKVHDGGRAGNANRLGLLKFLYKIQYSTYILYSFYSFFLQSILKYILYCIVGSILFTCYIFSSIE